MHNLFQDNFFKIENELTYSPISSYENEDDFRFNPSEEDPFKLGPFLKKDKESEWNIFNLDDKTTANQTFSKDNLKQFIKNSEKEEKKYYLFEDIKEILRNSKTVDFSKIQSYLIKDSRIQNAENALQFIKKKRNKSEKSEGVLFENKIKFGSGRKRSNDKTEREHNKFSSDNIAKKIKSKFFENAKLFINNFLVIKNLQLKDLDYQYINNIRKNEEIKYLGEPLKDLLSKKISSKFSNSPADSNKQIIDFILKTEKNNKVLMSALNLKVREWIDLFLLKKNVTDLENLNYSCYKEIEEKMPKINDLLENILENNGGEYLSSFVFYLYNYERYFFCKRERKKNSK